MSSERVKRLDNWVDRNLPDFRDAVAGTFGFITGETVFILSANAPEISRVGKSNAYDFKLIAFSSLSALLATGTSMMARRLGAGGLAENIDSPGGHQNDGNQGYQSLDAH